MGTGKGALFTLTALERRLVECAAKGEEFDCAAPVDVTGDEIDAIKDWEKREIRAEVIVALCTAEMPDWSVHPRRGLQLRGACVVGKIDLSRADLTRCALAFDTCRFEEGVVLSQATTADLCFNSCSLPSLDGNELESSSSLYLTKVTNLRRMSLVDARFRGVVDLSEVSLANPDGIALNGARMSAANVSLIRTDVMGEVRFEGAKVSGELCCGGDTHLSNPPGPADQEEREIQKRIKALHCARLVAGEVRLSNTHVVGEVNFEGAQITGEFLCVGNTKLDNHEGFAALSCDGMSTSNMTLREAEVEGVVRLLGATIDGQLLCRRARLINPEGYTLACDGVRATSVFLRDAQVEGEVTLLRANISGALECSEGTELRVNPGEGRSALSCDGMRAASLYLLGTPIEGVVRLLGATIDGQLACQGARLINPGGYALTCDGLNAIDVAIDNSYIDGQVNLNRAQIRGGLFCVTTAFFCNPENDRVAILAEGLSAPNVMLRHIYVKGAVSLQAARISGDLLCDANTHLINGGRTAFNGRGLEAANLTLFGSHAQGAVDLVGATINGTLLIGSQSDYRRPTGGQSDYWRQTELINPTGAALRCQDLMAANMFLQNTQVEGEVNLWSAQISSDFYCREATQLHNLNRDGEALSAVGCQIGGRLRFSLAEAAVGTVNLARAKVGTLEDDLDSWPGTVNLEGFSYDLLDGDKDPDKRLEWIRKSKRFSPDVYSQLAAVYRRSGEERNARKVAIARERARKPRFTRNPWRWSWNHFLDATVRYGYEPWRALVIFMVLFALGWLLFAQPPAREAIVPAPQNARIPANATEKACKDYPCFSPLVYSLDTLLPVIDLHQESNWVPSSDQLCGKYQYSHHWYQFPTRLSNRMLSSGWTCGKWYERLSWILIGAGWFLTTAVAAGIGSLWRRE